MDGLTLPTTSSKVSTMRSIFFRCLLQRELSFRQVVLSRGRIDPPDTNAPFPPRNAPSGKYSLKDIRNGTGSNRKSGERNV
jgi:hypothetical protein